METNARTMAALLGSAVYRGSVCSDCGGDVRYTTSCHCVACHRAAAKATRDKIKAALVKGRKRARRGRRPTIEAGGLSPVASTASGLESAPSAPSQNPVEGVDP